MTKQTTEEPKLTQLQMVKRAVDAGYSKPSDGVAWIEAQFGVSLKPNVFSTAKFQLSKKTPEAKPASETPTTPQTFSLVNGRTQRQSPAPQPAITYANPFPMDAELATTIKGLIAKYGADEVARMVELAKMFIG